MKLRPYQQEAVDAVWSAFKGGVPSPLVCLPTGAGKTPVVAEMLRQLDSWGKRCLVIAPSIELVHQIHATCRAHAPMVRLGVYAASAGKKETHKPHIVGQIHSLYNKTHTLKAFDCIIIDEAHMVPPNGMGMYRTLIEDQQSLNVNLRIIGLTATPYRLGSGLVFGDDSPFDALVYDANVGELIEQGYLSKLRGKCSDTVDLAGVRTVAGDYHREQVDRVMSDAERVKRACAEIAKHATGRHGILAFCCSVQHALMVSIGLEQVGITAPIITGETDKDQRAKLIDDYKARRLRALVNVNILTTGFDAPHVDLIAMLRPTQSPGLYYQICGRGLRKADGKNDCLILDMAGNIDRHGPLNLLNEKQSRPKSKRKGGGEAPHKQCLVCGEYCHASVTECTDCGTPFPEKPQARHDVQASNLAPIAEADIRTHEVDRVQVFLHQKNGKPDSVRVEYMHGMLSRVHTEWVCAWHDGFAGVKGRGWFAARRLPVPGSAAEAVEALRGVSHKITPVAVDVDHSQKYARTVRVHWTAETMEAGE